MRTPCSAYLKLLCLLLFSFAAGAASAATIHVPGDQPTIQAGINAAANGDTVLVAPGTYYENIDFKGKAITVTSSGGDAQTIIDGGYKNPAVVFQSHETRSSILSGFTIQHGGVSNLFFGDAGIYVTSSAPTIVNNIITHNLCRSIHISVASPLIQNNNINNTEDPNAQCAFAGGSAIWVEGAQQPASGTPPLPPTIVGNTIENNTQSAKEDAGGSGGAGIAVWGGEPVIENNTIRNNVTYGLGGGINITSGGAVIVQNLIYNNTAAGAGGLAINFGTASSPGPVIAFIINNTIADNLTAGQYGYSGDFHGSQVYVWIQSPQTAFVNNIIYGSSTTPLVICDPSWESSPYQDTIFDHNDVFNSNPQGSLFGGTCSDKTGTFGNISADPLFVNAPSSDFHLTAASPAIDAGNNSAWDIPAKDFDGNPREQDFTGKNYPVIDIGAYEHAGLLNADSTVLTLFPSAYLINAGVAFSLSSQLISASGTPTGAVTFFQDGKQIGSVVADATGKAVISSPGMTPGLHSFIATYPGQGLFPPAISVVAFVVANQYVPALTLTSSANPSLLNQPVTFTVTASSPDGFIPTPITLTDGSTTLATLTPDSSGTATFTTSSLAIGSHQIRASYPGDATHTSAFASLAQNVVNGFPIPSTITSSANPAAIGQSVTFTDTITFTSGNPFTGPATGTVTFYDNYGAIFLGSQPIATQPNTTAAVTFTTSTLTIGTHHLTAILTSSNGYTSAPYFTQVIVGQPTTTSLVVSPTSSYALQPITLTAAVAATGTAIPTGSVTFYDGATTLGSSPLDTSGHAALTITSLAGGIHLLHAVYTGDATFASSTSVNVSVSILLIPTTTTLTLSPNPSAAAQPVTATVQVAPLTSPSYSSQLCSCTVTVTIAGLPPNVGSTYTMPVHNGVAAFSFGLGFSPGTYTFSAVFSGDADFAPSSSASVQQTVVLAPTALTLTASPNPAVQNQTVNLTAVLTAPVSATLAPGTITFSDGTTSIGSASFGVTGPVPAGSVTNTAAVTISTSTLAAGTHTITATYPGNIDFLPATSAPVTLVINPQDFAIAVSPSALTIKTEHHLTTRVTLASIGSFADIVDLACSDLPAHASCTFDRNSLQLQPNGTATADVIIDTDDVHGYASNESPQTASPIAYALLLPVGLLTFFAVPRRRSPLRLLLILIAIGGLSLTLNGCSGRYPGSTPPGTYTFHLNGAGADTKITHSQTITLIVTP